MKKSLGIIVASGSYLFAAATAFAQGAINLKPPAQAIQIADAQIANIPSFIITLLFVVGIAIAVAFLIYGGIKWILSGGDKSAVEAARNHIIAAIVGLVIILAAYFIINVVFTLLTGRTFNFDSGFCIPTLAAPRCL